ncbi:MAG: DUF7487 domain-containing protein [Nitrosopumilaceae archaeon]
MNSWNIEKRTFCEYCSYKCAANSSDTQEKIKQTNLKRYGTENPSQSEDIKEKKKQTCIKHYGVENPFQSQQIQERYKQTNLERYGCVWNIASDQSRKKQEQTNLTKYGVRHPWMSKEIQVKRKRTWLKRYGTENPSQSEDIKEKKKQTCIKHYGVENQNQKHMINVLPLLEAYDWLYNEYVNKKKTALQIAEDLGVNGTTIGVYLKNHDIIIRWYGFSYKCIMWLESIMKEQNIFIQHAQNGGEYRIPGTRLRVDGYCEETNTVYEFYGDLFHGNPEIFESHVQCNPFSDLPAGKLFQKTIEREKIIKKLSYNIIIKWENTFKK